MLIDERGREAVPKSPHRRVGFISCSWLQEEQVGYESLLELNFARIALLCPELASIRSQPFSLTFPDGTKYTPDFRLNFANKLTIIAEVKPSKFVRQHKEKLDAAADFLRSHGFTFLIATEEQIYKGGRDAKASVYIRYARSHYPPNVVMDAMAKMNAQLTPCSIDTAARSVNCPRELVLHLIGIRQLAVGPSLDDQVYVPSALKELRNGDFCPASWLNN
ncbi:TnsA endonuclease N-terminal domain-containing protein [Achromobacter insolitus]|uniref:TnsA endonuclease N-terminal domain-containing protein n=1 Tax=Achromobacter insolitus TaxID=217204 RepID=UPI00241DA48F|nr:TnsA endonuclease N-terminal domain-containing protein [Achromobacter insolitus]